MHFLEASSPTVVSDTLTHFIPPDNCSNYQYVSTHFQLITDLLVVEKSHNQISSLTHNLCMSQNSDNKYKTEKVLVFTGHFTNMFMH